MAAGHHSWYSNLPWDKRSRDQIQVGVTFAMSIQTSPEAHPSSYTVRTRSFLEVKQWRHGADYPSPFRTQVMNWLELYLEAIRWMFFYTHNNGTYSYFLLQSLWMDWEIQKHGLAFMSMKTSKMSHNSVHYRCHFISVLYNLIYFGTQTLFPSSLTTNSLLPLLKFGSPLHFYLLTLYGNTSL
jgi:hypothetical protein